MVLRSALVLSAASALAGAVSAQPAVDPRFVDRVRFSHGVAVPGSVTQICWGPDGRLYAITTGGGAHSFRYNSQTGALDQRRVAASGLFGVGIAFHRRTLYISTIDGSIWRLLDQNGNGRFGEAGETRVAIATGVPVGDHPLGQLVVRDNSLYVGVGQRTINGRNGPGTGGSIDDFGGTGFWSGGAGNTWGESAYGGAIAWIRDLFRVPSVTGAANAYANSTLSQNLIQNDFSPFTEMRWGKLTVHSAGSRNPFGLGFDSSGRLFFTNNFNRTDTLGNGESGPGLPGDVHDSDFRNDVYDQFFLASPGADYGYANENYRGRTPMLTPGSTGYHRVNSITYDQLFNGGPYRDYDPANPRGLGPHSSITGFDFWYHPTLRSFNGNAFAARWNRTATEAPGGRNRTLNYNDVVAIHPDTGRVARVMTGFGNPIDCLWDGGRRMLVADYGFKFIYVFETASL
jgi:hypothetical protein